MAVSLPPPVIPRWLDPACEWTDADEAKLVKPAPGLPFILSTFDLLRTAHGLDPAQACEVTAHFCEESGYGARNRAANYGGVKVSKNDARPGLRWWKAPGHVEGGDAVWCFYKVYAGFPDFVQVFLNRFLPRAGFGRYAATGAAFWSHREPWFPLLVAAGYKGEVTRAHPHAMLVEEAALDLRVEHVVAQRALHVKVDGRWGDGSRAACRAFQSAAGLPPTGEIDAATLWKLFYPADAVPAWASAAA